jgi:aryl-alcohol dehydrogenase-like predicted oxidoreductase
MRSLGISSLRVAPLALGGNVFGWTADKKTAFEILDAFVDFGFNLIDTANIYSTWVPGNKGGESESIIGEWIKKSRKRDLVCIATKVGMEMPGFKGLTKDQIVRSVEESLERLQTDVIDLYQAHEDDPKTPLEETLGAFDQLVKQGKVRFVGASNYDAERLDQALSISQRLGITSYVSLQPYYNLYDRERFERSLEQLCLEKQLGIIPYFSLAKGFLTGKYRSKEDLNKSLRGSSVERYLDDRGIKIINALDAISTAHQVVPAVIALAWLLQRTGVSAAIASVTSVEQLAELAKVSQIKLSSEEIIKLNTASSYV